MYNLGDIVRVRDIGRCVVLRVSESDYELYVRRNTVEFSVSIFDVTLVISKDSDIMYKKVYSELSEIFLRIHREYAIETRMKNNGAIPETRLVTAAIGYFSKLICGHECPDNNWVNSIEIILDKSKKDFYEDNFR